MRSRRRRISSSKAQDTIELLPAVPTELEFLPLATLSILFSINNHIALENTDSNSESHPFSAPLRTRCDIGSSPRPRWHTAYREIAPRRYPPSAVCNAVNRLSSTLWAKVILV